MSKEISYFHAPVSNVSEQIQLSWEELFNMAHECPRILPDTSVRNKAKYGQYFVRGLIADGKTRHDAHLAQSSLLILDIDKPLEGQINPLPVEISNALSDIEHVVYTSVTAGNARLIFHVDVYDKKDTNSLTWAMYNFCLERGLKFGYTGESDVKSQAWFIGQTADLSKHTVCGILKGVKFTPSLVKDTSPAPISSKVETPSTSSTPSPEPPLEHNPTKTFIAELKKGTLHEAVKAFAGWKHRTSNLTQAQIFDEIDVLVESFCPEKIVTRWFNQGEKAGWLKWFEESVSPVPDQQSLKDLDEQDYSLKIPDKIWEPSLMKLAFDGVNGRGTRPIHQYQLPVILSVIGQAISSKIEFDGVYTNTYSLLVGVSSSGKTRAVKLIRKALNRAGIEKSFFGVNNVSSGPAILAQLKKSPSTIFLADEITSYFTNSIDSNAEAIKGMLIELYDSTGLTYDKGYAQNKDDITIESPCLSFLGNATDDLFNNISARDITTGLLPRLNIYAFDGQQPYYNHTRTTGKELDLFAEKLKKLFILQTPKPALSVDGEVVLSSVFSLGISEDAEKFRIQLSNEITDKANGASDSNQASLISRSYDDSIKFAMIHMACSREPKDLFNDIELEDLKWGNLLASILLRWSLSFLMKKIISGEFHEKCEMFLKGLRRVIKLGKTPSYSSIKDRAQSIKNWDERTLKNVVDILVLQEEIFVDNSTRTTKYILLK